MHVPAWPVLPSSTLAQNEIAEKFRVPSLMGMGSYCDDYPDDCGMAPVPDDGKGAGGSPAGVKAPTPAPGPVIDWTKVVGGATQGVTDIAKLVLIQPGTVQQGGSTIRQTPGFAVPVPATSTNVGVKADTGGSLLIAAAVAGVALLFLLKGKG